MTARVIVSVGVGVVALGSVAYLVRRVSNRWLRQDKWIKVGTVTNLVIHPVKSGQGIYVTTAECTTLGLRNGQNSDRRLMLTSLKNTKSVDGIEIPKLVLLKSNIDHNNVLSISADGHDSIEVVLDNVEREAIAIKSRIIRVDVEGFDCGDAVANWICNVVGKEPGDLRLIYMSDGVAKRLVRSDPEFGFLFKKSDKAPYSTRAAYMLMTEQSVTELNKRFPDEDISIRRFRPSIIISTPNVEPFDEDKWTKVKINDSLYRVGKPCQRCPMTTVEPDKGVKHELAEPLCTLRKFRLCKPEHKSLYGYAPLMGINLGIDKCGTISVGDEVFVCYRD